MWLWEVCPQTVATMAQTEQLPIYKSRAIARGVSIDRAVIERLLSGCA